MQLIKHKALAPLTIFAILIIKSLTGCSTGMTLCTKDGLTAVPLEGIPVERFRPVTLCEKVCNPIGAFYFPYRSTGIKLTDKRGEVFFNKITSRDTYNIYLDRPCHLTVVAWNKKLLISPNGHQLNWSNCVYIVRFEKGLLIGTIEKNHAYNTPVASYDSYPSPASNLIVQLADGIGMLKWPSDFGRAYHVWAMGPGSILH